MTRNEDDSSPHSVRTAETLHCREQFGRGGKGEHDARVWKMVFEKTPRPVGPELDSVIYFMILDF